MQSIWLDSYPDGVGDEVDLSLYDSIVHLFRESVNKFRRLPAYTCMGTTLSFDELDQRSAQFAAYLTKDLGLVRGDRIAIMMPNVLQYPIAMFGALRAGLVVVNTNPLYTERELEHQLSDSGAKAVVILENFAHTLEKALDKAAIEHIIVTSLGEMLNFPKNLLVNLVVRHVKKMVPKHGLSSAITFKEALKKRRPEEHTDAELHHEDIAYLQYTGGTTGVAKGAVLTHGNIVANMLQARMWIESDGELHQGDELIVTALPLYHIFALTANCLVFLSLGAHNLLITNPRDIPGFVKEMSKYRFTVMTGVNTLFNALLHNEEFCKLDFSHLKIALGGGMAVQRAVADRWQEVTKSTLVEAYGLTEASPAVCINPLDIGEYNGSIGLPIPSTQIGIFDENGKELPVGEVGELYAKGPQVMRGYWQRPEETAKVLDEEGWLKTGDVAKVDENGYVYIVDRVKDMILVSGFNVYPNEIEDVLAAHPKVLEAGAIGLPDEHSGEVVKVCVVKSDDSLTDAELLAYCKEQMTGYKVPKRIEFVDELPKTNVGKILRRELRAQHGAG